MEDTETIQIMCEQCGNIGFNNGSDGFFYCIQCGCQAVDIMETGVADEDFVDKGGDTRGALYSASNRRQHSQTVGKTETLSQYQSQSLLWSTLNLDQEMNTLKKAEGDTFHVSNNGGLPFDSVGPTSPDDFAPSGTGGSRALQYDDFYNEVRIRYIMGLQLMIQLQCEALVRDINVSPLICGIAGPIWFRFLASTKIMADEWADETILESESQKEGVQEDVKPRAKYRGEPHNIHGQRAVIIWYRSMRKKIPLSYSLAMSFLACHVAREPILPTDIIKWSTEGKLPYFAAFIDIERNIGPPSRTCPLSSSLMFRPSHPVPSQKLESLAASIALSIGLDLPPVNFYAIASRYLRELSLPAEKIFPHACRLHKWSMPPGLWLSANKLRLPTRVCVMSVLLVAIRILYNINGFGEWEKSLSKYHDVSSQPIDIVMTETGLGSGQKENFGNDDGDRNDSGGRFDTEASNCPKGELYTSEILKILGAQLKKVDNSYEYNIDLHTYLKYCQDVVFAGLEPSFEDYEEEKVIKELWEIYQKDKDVGADADGSPLAGCASEQKRCGDDGYLKNSPSGNTKRLKQDPGSPSLSHSTPEGNRCPINSFHGDDGVSSAAYVVHESFQDKAFRQLKLDMEENRFLYIPPRVKVKRLDYLHYVRKRDDGSLAYVAHADYYILLRACARVAEVDIRCMHVGVLDFERRLGWLENRIDHCLQVRPP